MRPREGRAEGHFFDSRRRNITADIRVDARRKSRLPPSNSRARCNGVRVNNKRLHRDSEEADSGDF
jgi:hypothetical protein